MKEQRESCSLVKPRWLIRSLLFWLIVFRMANSLLVATFFDPDEYWQSLEVAHSYVFRYGYQTWEWELALRGFLHPSLFALFYAFLQFFHLDSPWVVVRLFLESSDLLTV